MKVTDAEGNIVYHQDFSENSGDEDSGVKHTVTVNYVYADGTTAAPSATKQVSEGKYYAIQSPKISGFLPDQSAVYAQMGTEDVTVTVTYAAPLKVTIHYVKADGTKMFDDHVIENLAVGASYSVSSIAVANYSANPKTVEGVIGNEDVEVTVVYTPVAKKYTLTIRYIFEDYTQAAQTHTSQYTEGDSYSVESPAIDGFTPNQTVVAADGIKSNVSVTVVYQSNDSITTEATSDDTQNEKSGCGSVVGLVSVLPVVLGAAWISLRKREI